MPTPYGSRGGMAFSADELRVLRAALAAALRPTTPPPGGPGAQLPPERAAEVRAYARLAAAVEEAAQESRRLRAFQQADLARYRAALPGSAAGYLAHLSDALATGYPPRPDDLAAVRALRAAAATDAEADRRAALLRRCERLAAQAVRAREARQLPASTRPYARPPGGPAGRKAATRAGAVPA